MEKKKNNISKQNENDPTSSAMLNLLDDLKEEIKARKLTEEKLLKSEEHFRALIENSSEGISIIDIMGNTTYSSPSMKNVLGYSEESVKKMNFLELVHPDYLGTASEIFRRFISGKTNTETVQILMKHKNGKDIWIEATGTNMLENDSIKGIVINFRNIERRKKAEHKLSVMAKMLDIAPNAITIHDLNGKFIYTNSKNLELHGYTFDEMMSLNLHQLDVPESEALINQQIEKIKNTGEASFEVFHFRKDGTSFPLMVFAKIIEWQDRPALISIASDLTEKKKEEIKLKESEEKFRTLITQMQSGLAVHEIILDEKGNPANYIFLDVNPSFEKLTGLKRDDVIGKTVLEILPKTEKIWIEKYGRVALTGEPVSFENYSHELNRFYRVTAYRPREKQFAVVIEDITDRKKAEEKLNENLALTRIAGEIAKLGGWTVDLNENRSYWSDEVAAIHEMPAGYAPLVEEGINFYAPEWREKITQVFTACAKEGIPYNEKMEIITATGKRIWIKTIGEAVRNEKGRIIKVHGAFQDITEEVEAGKKLKESEEKFRQLAESSTAGIFIHSGDRFEYVNKTTSLHTGFSLEELYGMKFIDIIYPEDRKMVMDIWQKRSKGEKIPDFYESRLNTKDGGFIWAVISGTLIKYKGQDALIGTAFNITAKKEAEIELKESEERYKALHNASFGGIAIHDKGLILECNQGLSDITGYSYQELIGMNGLLLIAEHAREKVIKNINDGYELPYESTGVRKNGEEYPLRLEARNVPFKGKQVRTVEFRDITNQKKAEIELEKNRKFLSDIIENSGSLIFVKDVAGKYILTNSRWETATGLKRENTLGKTDLELFPDPMGKQFRENDVSVIESGKILDTEEFLEKNNEKFFFHSIKFPLKDASGRITGICGMATDITGRKLAEEKLRKSKYTLQKIFDTLPIGLWFADNTGKLVSGNPAGIKIWGAEPKVGLNEYGIFKARKLPERTEITPDEWALAKTIQEGVTISNELLEIDAFDGKKKIILNYTAPIIDKDTVLGAIVINEDITEMKKAEDAIRESEDRFRTVLEYSHSAICVISTEGKIVWANEALIKIGGYSREAICSAPSFAQFIAPDSLEFVTGNFMKFVSGNDYEHHYDFYFIRSDGSKRLMEKHMTDYTDKNGQRFLAVSMSDITEKKEAEEEKEKLQAQLYQAQKMESIGRLAGGVAHDFNNMLSVIIGRVELALMKTGGDSPLLNELVEIQNAAERSAALTRQLLAFARKQMISPKILNTNESFEKIFVLVKRLIGENIELNWSPQQYVWNIMMDPSQLDQIFTNLCANAKDAMPDGGTITIGIENVTVERTDENMPGLISGDYVRISVEDNGTGMDKEVASKIFEPFFTTKELGKGTGLGLATVFGIVKQNKGFIYCFSIEGTGTRFEIYFPKKETSESENAVEKPANISKNLSATILLVEDEPAILEMGELMLQSFGYSVVCARSPQEALKKSLDHKGDFDLLITDVIMPEMNGRELAKKIMSYHPQIKCLFMSGYTADVIANEGIISEEMNFIQKPFTMKTLGEKVKTVMGGK